MASPRSSRLPRSAAFVAAGVAAHWLYLALGIPGGRVVSDVLFVAAPGVAGWLCWRAASALTGPARLVWRLLALAAVCWIGANGIWGLYEVVLDQQVPTPSPADWFFATALVVAVVAASTGLLRVVTSRSGALRVLFDVLLVGGSLVFLAWTTVLDTVLAEHQTPFVQTVTWLYPALGVVASTVAFATMTRVHARARLAWLLVGAAFLIGAAADTAWAYANVTGGFTAGGLIDPLWVIQYAAIGCSALLVQADAGLASTRLAPARWESLGAYVPVSLSVAAAAVQHGRGRLTSSMLSVGIGLVVVLVIRQVLAILENHGLARSLEQRVTDRTAELRASEAHFRSIVQSISDLVIITDADSRIRYQSPSVERMLGYSPDELFGTSAMRYVHADDRPAAAEAAERARRTAVTVSSVVRIRHRDGAWRHMEATISNLVDQPQVGGIVLAMRDVGERVELEGRLRHQAFHDALTGLANRALLHEQLNELLASGRQPSLLLLDLDEFKAVNDTAGHDLGDDVLKAVARRLLEATRPGDVVSRLGGDEFAIVLHDDPRADAAVAVADRVLHALRTPLTVQGRQVRCLGSIGVAAGVEGANAASLLRDADVAMYVAKARGKGRIELFTAAMRDAVMRRQHLEDLLRHAIADRRLVLLYQPVVELATGRVLGAEALLRLTGDDGEVVSPLEFVGVAEETGLIVEIGAWVLVEACRQAAMWQELRPDGPPLDVAVNVSTRQLHDPTLPRVVAAALDVTGLSPSLLTLEITEGALAAADPDVDATLTALRRLGVRLSIDDFGAGYSSLGRLRRLPVDELKIDRSFIGELGDGGAEAPLIDAILAMAGRLGLTVVAEGIETPEQADYLRSRSCHRAQGYLFAGPMVPDDLLGALRAPSLSVGELEH